MAAPKPYDTTLARIAGNIAAGMVSKSSLYSEEFIATFSARLAEEIVKRLTPKETA